ncbi:MAG: phosphatase PAP2 family protein [Phycisphaerales bacterium]|nr:phosphatase PAP2 family protein [Phycisphaerales bacterium]
MNIDTSSEVSRSRPRWGVPAALLAAGLLAFFALRPLDPVVESWVASARDGGWLTGDLRREWSALQQFGQGTSIALIALIVYLLDTRRERRARLLDFALALAVVGVAVTAMKWFIGRPRPKLGDPHTILWPWGTYPVPQRDGTTLTMHAWDFPAAANAKLWSLPSSHTAFAAVTALFLALMYPRVAWVAAFLAVVVGAGRLVFDAHWLTDVTTGAAVALALAWPVLTARPLSRRFDPAARPLTRIAPPPHPHTPDPAV